MTQRGRKSSAELSVVTPMPNRLLAPPDDLSMQEASVWSQVVATKPADWWDAGSMPLLAQYARAVVQSDTVSDLVSKVLTNLLTDPDELARYREMRKIQSALSQEMSNLARAMRLTQQARYRADKADTTSRKASGNRPWTTHGVYDSN